MHRLNLIGPRVIVVDNITVESGAFRLSDVSMTVPTSRYAMLMGRTGSGKTTLLEAIIGLKRVTAGSITLGDRDVTRLKPAERNIGYVPQDGALFTTMSVREHLQFALTIRNVDKQTIADRVDELANLLEIEPLLDRRIQGLSGGEQQRVAIGRALSFRPTTLLLDEPLSALDDDTREQMYAMLKHVQEATQVTTLHITHHIQDVERLGDLVFRIRDGKLSEETLHPRV